MSITLHQGLTSFDTEDVLSLWVYEAAESGCAALQDNAEFVTDQNTGFISYDVQNAQALNESGSISFDLKELPPDSQLAFLAKITDSSGTVITKGCNESEPIGKGNLLALTIILAPLVE